MRRWNPSLHPRDRLGRFTDKVSVGVRVSTRSVSVTAGRRFPIIPGKANLYVGGLVRLENASRSKGPIDRALDRVQDRVISALPDGAARNTLGSLLNEGSFRSGSTLVQASNVRPRTPTIRATRNANGRLRQGGTTYTQKPVGRQPRAPRQPRARRVA